MQGMSSAIKKQNGYAALSAETKQDCGYGKILLLPYKRPMTKKGLMGLGSAANSFCIPNGKSASGFGLTRGALSTV